MPANTKKKSFAYAQT